MFAHCYILNWQPTIISLRHQHQQHLPQQPVRVLLYQQQLPTLATRNQLQLMYRRSRTTRPAFFLLDGYFVC